MTLRGVVARTVLLLLLVTASAAYSWSAVWREPATAGTLAMGGALVGFALAMIISFRPSLSRVLAVPYALAEGFFIGTLSVLLETRFHGIVIQAVCLTFSVMFALLAAYQSGLIRVTQTFRSVVVAATGGIAVLYLANLVFGMFAHHSLPFLSGSGSMALGFSVLVCVIAALNLVLDFEYVAQGVQTRAPQWMEWYGAFALTVTLVWLYIEILRLLANLRRSQ